MAASDLFTKNGISGPLAFIVSSVFARENYSVNNPVNLELNLHSIKIDKVLDGMGFPKNYYELKNINEVVK